MRYKKVKKVITTDNDNDYGTDDYEEVTDNEEEKGQDIVDTFASKFGGNFGHTIKVTETTTAKPKKMKRIKKKKEKDIIEEEDLKQI